MTPCSAHFSFDFVLNCRQLSSAAWNGDLEIILDHAKRKKSLVYWVRLLEIVI